MQNILLMKKFCLTKFSLLFSQANYCHLRRKIFNKKNYNEKIP